MSQALALYHNKCKPQEKSKFIRTVVIHGLQQEIYSWFLILVRRLIEWVGIGNIHSKWKLQTKFKFIWATVPYGNENFTETSNPIRERYSDGKNNIPWKRNLRASRSIKSNTRFIILPWSLPCFSPTKHIKSTQKSQVNGWLGYPYEEFYHRDVLENELTTKKSN